MAAQSNILACKIPWTEFHGQNSWQATVHGLAIWSRVAESGQLDKNTTGSPPGKQRGLGKKLSTVIMTYDITRNLSLHCLKIWQSALWVIKIIAKDIAQLILNWTNTYFRNPWLSSCQKIEENNDDNVRMIPSPLDVEYELMMHALLTEANAV